MQRDGPVCGFVSIIQLVSSICWYPRSLSGSNSAMGWHTQGTASLLRMEWWFGPLGFGEFSVDGIARLEQPIHGIARNKPAEVRKHVFDIAHRVSGIGWRENVESTWKKRVRTPIVSLKSDGWLLEPCELCLKIGNPSIPVVDRNLLEMSAKSGTPESWMFKQKSLNQQKMTGLFKILGR